MDDAEYNQKVWTINLIIDFFYDTPPANPKLREFFQAWLFNGDFEEEKNAALFRKFEMECEIEEMCRGAGVSYPS